MQSSAAGACVSQVWEILNLKGNRDCIIGSKVTAMLLEGWSLPLGGVASGRVCACSLHSSPHHPQLLKGGHKRKKERNYETKE